MACTVRLGFHRYKKVKRLKRKNTFVKAYKNFGRHWSSNFLPRRKLDRFNVKVDFLQPNVLS